MFAISCSVSLCLLFLTSSSTQPLHNIRQSFKNKFWQPGKRQNRSEKGQRKPQCRSPDIVFSCWETVVCVPGKKRETWKAWIEMKLSNSGLYWNFFQCLQTANWNWELLRDILRQMLQQANVIWKVVAWWFREWADCDKLDKHEATTPLEENIDGK